MTFLQTQNESRGGDDLKRSHASKLCSPFLTPMLLSIGFHRRNRMRSQFRAVKQLFRPLRDTRSLLSRSRNMETLRIVAKISLVCTSEPSSLLQDAQPAFEDAPIRTAVQAPMLKHLVEACFLQALAIDRRNCNSDATNKTNAIAATVTNEGQTIEKPAPR